MKSFIFYDSYSILQRSNKNILCLLVIVLCNIQFSFSQENSLSIDKLLPDFNHLTPEAASLGKYGTIAMTEYTGTPNIRIPLLEVKSGDVSYPIELYYDASGISGAKCDFRRLRMELKLWWLYKTYCLWTR